MGRRISRKNVYQIFGVLVLLVGFFSAGLWLLARNSSTRIDSTQIDSTNWGWVTAPVYGTSESGVYAAAELFAGPNKFGSYFSGVLPNGAMVKPGGTTIQIGMNPLGSALTSDGKFLITSNDDEREAGFTSLQNPANVGAYTLSVVDTATMSVVSTTASGGGFFIGLAVTGSGPYTVWASGGPDNDVKLFQVSATGMISVDTPAHIPISPISPATAGLVSNYVPGPAFNKADPNGNKPPVPSGFDRVSGAHITFPTGSALSPDGKYLYVACNGDNSVAVIDTADKTVVQQVPVGYFPYTVAVNRDGDRIAVSNWGVTSYKFKHPTYDSSTLTAIASTPNNQPDGFYLPVTSTKGRNPHTSSISVLDAPRGNGALLTNVNAVYEGHPLDKLYQVGDTHPSAMALVHHGAHDTLYVTKANSDSLGMITITAGHAVRLSDVDLSPLKITLHDGHKIHGAYPNAIVASPDGKWLYVAEAGLNSVAVLSTRDWVHPRLVGRIPTDWYPTSLSLSGDGRFLYITNAKGIGEDINPHTSRGTGNPPPTGLASYPGVDSNYIFGTLQKVDLKALRLDNTTVLAQNYAIHTPSDTSVVPAGGVASNKIKHVIFILHENKAFDSMLGNLGSRFGAFASLTYNNRDGASYMNGQFTGVSLNTQQLASVFATAVNYYSDSEESDAGHQFCASGTATDYTEKTLLVKTGRGLLVNKNFEPEDYPEGGYIFNNAARNGVSFKDYGALVRIEGTDTGTSTPATLNDPPSGNWGLPQSNPNNFGVTTPLVNLGDVTSPTQGLGQTYFLALPILAILGDRNANGEPHLDSNYPGYNFNISDQRRALEFIKDFDRMVVAGTLPQFLYIYQPNDHTGGIQAPASPPSAATPTMEVADGDVALGTVVHHIMSSNIYYDPHSNTGSAIFITYDDAQSTLDHIHPHRTPLIVVSPFAKPAYSSARHYATASIVKTEELVLGLPPNNLGDLFATDLRDLFQSTYNHVSPLPVLADKYTASPEGKRIWALVNKLDTSAPDRDSARLGALARLSMQADELHSAASKEGRLNSHRYVEMQVRLYRTAQRLVAGPAPGTRTGSVSLELPERIRRPVHGGLQDRRRGTGHVVSPADSNSADPHEACRSGEKSLSHCTCCK
jgi:YVTN family beta-propeller protein